MEILEDTTAGIPTIALRGRLDEASAAGVQARLLQIVESGTHRFVMDLSQLEYCNSVGLRVFLTVAKRLTPFAGQIVLCAVQPAVQRLLEAAAFERIFTISRTRDEAALAIARPSA